MIDAVSVFITRAMLLAAVLLVAVVGWKIVEFLPKAHRECSPAAIIALYALAFVILVLLWNAISFTRWPGI